MKKMLPITILESDNIRYNSDLDYVDGDDIYKEKENKKIVIPDDKKELYINEYIINHVNENHPKLIYNKEKLRIGKICEYTSIVERKKINLSYDLMNKIDNIFWCQGNELRYYCDSDTILIPKKLKNDLFSGKQFNKIILIYNYDNAIKDHDFLKDCKIIEKTEPELKYLPDEITYTMFEKEYGEFIDNIYFLYKNMPLDMLDNVNTFMYDVTINSRTSKRLFTSFNLTKFNVYCYDVANYGIHNILPLNLNDDYSMTPINCSPRVIIAKLLNIPYIPVCIISSYYKKSSIDNYKQINVNLKKVQDFLYPDILIGDNYGY